MDIKELLEEDAFDPQKLFNEEEYSTLILDREGFTKKENQVADLVMQLLDKEVTREEAEAVFSRLKELNASLAGMGALNAVMNSLSESADDTKAYATNMKVLAKNLEDLNSVYGNMLRAMGK
ncbi:MAG: hypothetical protein EBU33_03805 [Sphingobacteriia bacterium]|nr:hypothetical protein [Sphingobacteriia bacterium]